MLSNILITLLVLIITTIILSRLFTLPRNIWVLFLAQPLVMSCSPVIVFIGGILSAQMVTDKTLSTLPITIMILGVAAGAIPAALLANKKGRKFAALFGFSITVTACLIASYAVYIARFEYFIIASVMFGFSTAFVQQLRFAAIESTKDEKSIPTVLSILMLSGIFAAFIGPEVAVMAKDWIDSPLGYSGSFLFLAVLVIIAMLVMLAFNNPTIIHQPNESATRPLWVIIKQPVFLVSIAAAAIGFALMSYLMTATPISMHHMQGHSINDTKWVIQSHIAAMFIPSLFTGFLVKKIGLTNLLMLGTIIYTIVAIIAFSGEQVMHYWWALLLLGVGWNFLYLTGTSLLPQSYQPNERHKVQAINDFIIFGFQATASLFAGWVLFKAGWHAVVFSSIPFIILLFAVSWYYYRKERVPKCDRVVL
ncbi:MFS transporter [Thalassotalea piscium]|uniref:MFS family permease n=1 Tax=Thalassotalea piscium TaxID=1230533 RepID=A0A7X0NJA1_9GAMM|nr:MFS transporter [Thalassotalea piscium]MBB6544494.1 MFS family permease [Thalassotalea piscium]